MTPAAKIYRTGKGECLPHHVQLPYRRPVRLDHACAQGAPVLPWVKPVVAPTPHEVFRVRRFVAGGGGIAVLDDISECGR